MVYSISQRVDDPRGLTFRGTPQDLIESFDSIGDDGDAVLEIAGLVVTDAKHGGRHNGQPGLVFDLAGRLGDRPVGRLVLIDRDDTRDETPEWTVWYEDEATASENLLILDQRANRPEISEIEVDVVFLPDENPDKVVAQWAADFGVSFSLKQLNGPGGGNPVYQVSGFTDRIEKWLRGPYDAGDDDVKMYLG